MFRLRSSTLICLSITSKIVKALCDQAQKLCLTSRAFYNDCLGPYEKMAAEYFGYDIIIDLELVSIQ